MEIIAKINRVLSHKIESNWALLLLSIEDRTSDDAIAEIRKIFKDLYNIPSVGIFTPLLPQACYKLTGELELNTKYDRYQFKVQSAQLLLDSTQSNEQIIIEFFKERIGQKTLLTLFEKFKKEKKDFLTELSLGAIPGLDPNRCKEYYEDWLFLQNYTQIIKDLEKYQIPQTFHAKIVRKWGETAKDILSTNLYRLTEIRGISFTIADDIAVGKNKYLSSDPRRLAAAIEYCLFLEEIYGHTYTPEQFLFNKVANTIRIKPKLENLPSSVIQTPDGNISFLNTYQAEHYIATKLLDLYKYSSVARWDKNLIQIKCNEKQGQFLDLAMQNNIAILTGGPGTGKTYAIKNLLDIYPHAVLLAPTGKAARRMEEQTKHPASTIHSYLVPTDRTLKNFKYGENAHVTDSVFVIDEFSMVDVKLFRSFLAALYLGCKVFLIGDSNQLPSIQPGETLKDIIHSNKFPTVELTEIMRQKEGSGIITNSQRILNGQTSLVEAHDFIQHAYYTDEQALEEILALLAADNTRQILVPMHKTTLGTQVINSRAQELLNFSSLKIKGTSFRVMDKIICNENRVDLNLSNGDIGIIQAYDSNTKDIHIEFNNRIQTLKVEEMDIFSLAYAITIHKSQGSEYNEAIIALSPSHTIMLQRNLLYTAITRAKDKCTLFASKEAVTRCIRNVASSRRTYLHSFLTDLGD